MTAYGLWGAATPASLMAEFVWPTRHWFVGAISLFCVAFFFILASGRPRYFEWLAALLLVPYAICYLWLIDLNRWSLEGGYFGWIFYAQVMLLGGALATRSELMVTSHWRRDVALLATFVLVYFASKLAMSATGFWRVQFILHVLTLPLVLLAIRVTAAPAIQRWTESTRPGRVATFISLISFEIYVTQHLFHSNAWLKSLPFPLGAALAFAGILALATVVMRLADRCRAAMRRMTTSAASSTADARP